MPNPNPTALICPSCGKRQLPAGLVGQGTPCCPDCDPRRESPRTRRPTGEVFNEVWNNLRTAQTWGQMLGWVILLVTTFVPVMVLWGSHRLKADEPLLPLCLAISAIGGAIGMPLFYPKKGYWQAGVVAGPLFGPGVFLAFGLLAGSFMNKLIFLLLVILGGGPSYALYVLLLYWIARQREAGS